MEIPGNRADNKPSTSSRGRGRGRGRGHGARGGRKSHSTRQSISETNEESSTQPSSEPSNSDRPKPKPRRKFNGSLTQSGQQSQPLPPIPQVETTDEDDIRSRLERELRVGKVECLICFEVVKTQDDFQRTHSCNTCFNVYHLKCITEWAKQSFGQPFKEGEQKHWRCPGCQTKSTKIPREYRCFCRRQRDPKPDKLAVPHSCGQSCSRKRQHCKHPCPLPCHPGPCMDCQTSLHVKCHCGKTTTPIKCAYAPRDPSTGKILPTACGDVCGKQLGCGQHTCIDQCHPGPCSPCNKVENSKCYCGKERSEKPCGTRGYLGKQACYSKDEFYIALWECYNVCGEYYDCNFHKCQGFCHPPSRKALTCPLSPEVITRCPCGKHALKELNNGERKSCQDPIASCGKTCGKSHLNCGHICKSKCHTDECPPCDAEITTVCRCGVSKVTRKCFEVQQEGEEVLCDRVCHSLRLCGKHECLKRCCPLREFEDRRGKRKALIDTQIPEEVMQMWHTCPIICGKTLSCGTHKCVEPDHKGKCGPCLNASFDELTCSCGNTTLEPPIPCGTEIHCTYPCNRPPPECGHPRPSHTCHGDDVSCPPCPFLTTRSCQCGKSQISNVRCSQENVRCGKKCDKIQECGHRCKKSCHKDECRGPEEACSSVCGRLRSICSHTDIAQCHGLTPCDESMPCQAVIIMACKCGTQKAKATCGASLSNTHSKQDVYLECKSSCAAAERNSRLARALGINDTFKRKIDYNFSSETIRFAQINQGFVSGIEKAYNEFIDSSNRALQLPLMNKSRSAFCIDYAEAYGFDTEIFEDVITIRRKIGSHLPSQLLTKLVDEYKQDKAGVIEFRKPSGQSTPQLSRQGSVSTHQSDDWEELTN
ncbi:hypothetical protein E3Q08_00454 [Wallemia mellicola]|uniref:R3H domain-containing protein n=1 Tax=Wallemia mellicola TaxID=1708541 RepID=A0A4T0LQS7_9BASI|nr:hypothetical protein E3Q24_01787 [Wallemia mellicola]TIC12518.1 hypothetical protein E3Q14_01758 [Wallemia mellicola]TIC17931.1 hypothetical protein E3Q15_00356 [Wallemia mellicola]TIC37926.1 hypothetical protein E3Q09_00595 [Wallemia mellicola]TIC46611.1 hypothetical protein E3Q08_00454 [Wallemia mellicola]